MNVQTETFNERWSRLRERTSLPDWKGRGSEPVASATWEKAAELLHVLSTEFRFTAPPFVSAGASGSITLSWGRAPGDVVRVEVQADGSFAWEHDGANGFESDENRSGREIVSRIGLLAPRLL